MTAGAHILLVHGPNLGRLGTRKPEIYGTMTLVDLTEGLRDEARTRGLALLEFQSNSEAAIIDFIEAHFEAAGMIINPGALMMAGWSLRDAVEEFPGPVIEVHLSNLWARERFRHRSVISPVVEGVIAGLGTKGYGLALSHLAARLGHR